MPLNFNAPIPASRAPEAPPTRTKKADRPFSPPNLSLRPSSLNVANRLMRHIGQRLPREQARVYASGIKNCARQSAMAIMGFAKGPVGEDNPEWSVAADLGTWLHQKVEGWLHSIGGLIRAEFRVGNDDISGRVDALIGPYEGYGAEIEVAEQTYILDAKTINARDFAEGAYGRKVPGYIAQISVYGRLLGVTKGIVLLVDRGSGKMTDFEFDIDPEYADQLLARAATIRQLAEARQLPPAEEWGDSSFGSFTCKNFCAFYRQCAAEQLNGMVQVQLDRGVDPSAL